MSRVKKARFRRQPEAGQAVEAKAACGAAIFSDFNSTTAAAVRQTGISALLLHGQENAVSLRHLEQMTGLPNRYLRRRIQEERLSGVPILSDNVSGYYLPADDQERQRFVRSMRGRAKEIETVAAAVEGAEV